MVQTVRHLVTVEEVRREHDRADHGDRAGRGERTLKVHHLRPAPGVEHREDPGRVVVRACKGKTAGRGTKGTKARYQVPAGFEGGQMPLHMRLPKLRGFKNPFRVEYQVVNLDRLGQLYPERRRRVRRRPRGQGRRPQGPAGQGARHRRARRSRSA